MNKHDIAAGMIEKEIQQIPTTDFPVEAESVARMASYMAYSLDAITSGEHEAYMKKIRGLELTRYLELLKERAA